MSQNPQSIYALGIQARTQCAACSEAAGELLERNNLCRNMGFAVVNFSGSNCLPLGAIGFSVFGFDTPLLAAGFFISSELRQ